MIEKISICIFVFLLLFSRSVSAESDEELFKKHDGKPIFVILEVDERKPYIQSQVIVKVRLFRLSSSFDASMSVPHLSKLEISQDAFLKELKGLSRRYRTEINENMYVVTERYYIIFPQQSGPVRLGPVRFQGYLVIGGTINFVEEESNFVILRVKPIPESFTGSEWLPARSISYFQDFHPQTDKLELGQAISRIIYLTASGITSGHLPEKIYKEIPGFKDYITESDREEMLNAEAGLTAVVNQEIALIAQKTGSLNIPDIVIPWWNTQTDQQETLIIPGKKIQSFSNAETSDSEETSLEVILNVPNALLLTEMSRRQFWLVGVFAFILLTAIILPILFRYKPQLRIFHLREKRLQSQALSKAVRACREHNPQQAEIAIIEFCQTLKVDQTWHSLSDCPLTHDPVMADQLETLLTSRYGQPHMRWNGDQLAKLLPDWFTEYLKSEAYGKYDQTRLHDLYPLVSVKK